MKPNSLQWLFATPIIEFNLSQVVNTSITNALLKMPATTNGFVHGIRGAENPADIPEAAPLYQVFQQCVNEYSQKLGLQPNLIASSWVNILRVGGAITNHRHHDSIVSGAYYPYVSPNSAPLVFVSPLDGYRMMDSQPRVDGRNPYAENAHRVLAETGKLVLFPSWLQHYVPPNASELRITLSFNTQFDTVKGPPPHWAAHRQGEDEHRM